MPDTTFITETPYCSIYANPNRQSLDVVWHETTEQMTNDEFREHLLLFAATTEEQQPRFLFVYAQNMRHAIAAPTQEWHDEYIIPRYSRAGVERMAFMLPESFFARLSHEQTFEETQAQQLIETQFFTDEDEANAWLQS